MHYALAKIQGGVLRVLEDQQSDCSGKLTSFAEGLQTHRIHLYSDIIRALLQLHAIIVYNTSERQSRGRGEEGTPPRYDQVVQSNTKKSALGF